MKTHDELIDAIKIAQELILKLLRAEGTKDLTFRFPHGTEDRVRTVLGGTTTGDSIIVPTGEVIERLHLHLENLRGWTKEATTALSVQTVGDLEELYTKLEVVIKGLEVVYGHRREFSTHIEIATQAIGADALRQRCRGTKPD